MIVLPEPADRSWLSAFGAALGALVALGSLALGGGGQIAVAATAATAAGILLLLSIWRPEVFAVLYDLYVRVTRRAARGVRSIVLRAAHATVIGCVGLAGSSISREKPRTGESLWVERHTLDPAHYASLWDGPGSARGGLRDFIRWSFGGGRVWALCLVPFLVLLRVSDTEGGRAFPTRIYTLY